MMKKLPARITVCYLEVIIVPNGEVMCLGQSLGWFSSLKESLTPKRARKQCCISKKKKGIKKC